MTAIFESCCALHNQLLEYDGWEFDDSLTDVPENIHYGAFVGHDDFMGSENSASEKPHYVPHCPSDSDDSDDGTLDFPQGSEKNIKCLRHCRHLHMKSMLINHFCILKKERKLVWPRHKKIANT